MFNSIFYKDGAIGIDFGTVTICLAVALICGIALAFTYYYSQKCTKGMFIAVSMIPMITALIIMLVNGDIGMGLTVAGVFGFIRFRSYQGSAREMATIFLTMALGFVLGRGYVLGGVIFAVVGCVLTFVLVKIPLDVIGDNEKLLTITVPESLNYSDAFTDLFEKYTGKSKLIRVKTTGMGTLYELRYQIELKNGVCEKEMIDEIRCRNANMSVIVSVPERATEGL